MNIESDNVDSDHTINLGVDSSISTNTTSYVILGLIVVTVIVICLFRQAFIKTGETDRGRVGPNELHGTPEQCVVDNSLYPEITSIVANKDLILDELTAVIKSGAWSTWGSSYDDDVLDKTPRFSDMSSDEKIQHLDKNKSQLGNNRSWKLFGLILEKNPINENILKCSSTYSLIKNIPGLINAGFSCLEPHSKTPYHNDKDKRFYRVHIPLVVPNVSDELIGLNVYNNKGDLTKLNWKTDYFVFDDTCYHQAFNDSDYHRIVLLLDVERRLDTPE